MSNYAIYNIPLRGDDTPPLWSNWEMASGIRMLLEKYDLAGTWLPRYDALCHPAYADLCAGLGEKHEVGLWLEITSSHAEAAGVSYGIGEEEEWFWARHALTMGYTQEERIRLIDVIMRRFRELMGSFPRTVSMWMIDSFSAEYMNREYGVSAIGLCRNQYGIDGYTLWGGWSNLPYWPSKRYIWQPASTLDGRGNYIVYPLITEDTLVNYGNDKGIWSTEASMLQLQDLSADRVNDYIRQLTEYTLQNGFPVSLVSLVTENSWDWGLLSESYEKQAKHLASLCSEDAVRVLTAGEYSKIYAGEYPELSPAQVWYQPAGMPNPLPESACITACTRSYRARLRTDFDGSGLRLTDLRVYNEQERDPYWQQRSEERFASWIIPFLIDSSLYRINGKSGTPLVDIAHNEATYLVVKASPVSPARGDESLQQLTENLFLWRDTCLEVEWLLGEEEIRVAASPRIAGQRAILEMICSYPISIDVTGDTGSQQINGDDAEIKTHSFTLIGGPAGNVSLGITSDNNGEELSVQWIADKDYSRLLVRGQGEDIRLRLRPAGYIQADSLAEARS